MTRRDTATARAQSCAAVRADLSAYADRDLRPARCRAITRHLGQCLACQAQARRLARIRSACRAVGAAPPPAEVRARALARVRRLFRR